MLTALGVLRMTPVLQRLGDTYGYLSSQMAIFCVIFVSCILSELRGAHISDMEKKKKDRNHSCKI